VDCQYRFIGKGRFGFAVPDRRVDLPLTIDPDLRWSTHLGGAQHDGIVDVEWTPNGALVVAGYSGSPNFPTTPGAYQTTQAGQRDVFVSSLDAGQTGSRQLRWSTFIGGGRDDVALGVAVDPGGDIVVVGYTCSSSYPITMGPAFVGVDASDSFVTRLDASGTGLVYSRLLGGTKDDWLSDVVIDSASVTTVVGTTRSVGFQTTSNAFQASHQGFSDCTVTRLDTAGRVVYSSYLGGSYDDVWDVELSNRPSDRDVMSVALDAQECLVLAGSTKSPNFPVTAGAYQTVHGGTWYGYTGTGALDAAFVARLDPGVTPASAQLQWSTFLGGRFRDLGLGLDVQPSGEVTIVGCTYSPDFPTTPGAYSRTFVGTRGGPINYPDAFVARLNPAVSGQAQLMYSTYLASAEWDCLTDVVLDSRGYATVTGFASPGFPVTAGSFQASSGGGQDAWVGKLTLGGVGSADLLYGSFLGGLGGDQAAAVVPDGKGGAVIVGTTWSSGFPVNNPFQSTKSGARDGFVAQLDLLPSNVLRLPGAAPHCEGEIVFEVDTMPLASNQFLFLVGNAPPSSSGGLVFGTTVSPCFAILGARLCVQPLVAVPVTSDASGTASVPVVAPPGLNGSLAVQTVWFNTVVCAGVNPLSSSAGLGL